MRLAKKRPTVNVPRLRRAFNTYIDVDPEKEHQKFMGHLHRLALCLLTYGIIDPLTQDHSDLAFVDVPDPGLAHF